MPKKKICSAKIANLKKARESLNEKRKTHKNNNLNDNNKQLVLVDKEIKETLNVPKEITSQICNFMKGSNNFFCKDCFIPSSKVYNLLRANYSINTIHNRFKNSNIKKLNKTIQKNKNLKTKSLQTQRNNKIHITNNGIYGEAFFLQSNINNVKLIEPCALLPNVNLVSCVPDFIIKEDNSFMVIEIKTSTNLSTNLVNKRKPTPRDLVQLWLCLDSFGIDTGKLIYYNLRVNNDNASIFEKREFIFKKPSCFFNKNIYDLFVNEYANFLDEYLAFCGLDSEQYKKEFMSKMQKKYKDLIKTNIDYTTIKKKLKYISHDNFCIVLADLLMTDDINSSYIQNKIDVKEEISDPKYYFKQKTKAKRDLLKTINVTESSCYKANTSYVSQDEAEKVRNSMFEPLKSKLTTTNNDTTNFANKILILKEISILFQNTLNRYKSSSEHIKNLKDLSDLQLLPLFLEDLKTGIDKNLLAQFKKLSVQNKQILENQSQIFKEINELKKEFKETYHKTNLQTPNINFNIKTNNNYSFNTGNNNNIIYNIDEIINSNQNNDIGNNINNNIDFNNINNKLINDKEKEKKQVNKIEEEKQEKKEKKDDITKKYKEDKKERKESELNLKYIIANNYRMLKKGLYKVKYTKKNDFVGNMCLDSSDKESINIKNKNH